MDRLDTRPARTRRRQGTAGRNLVSLAAFAAAVVGVAYVLGWLPGRTAGTSTASAAAGRLLPHRQTVRDLLSPTPGHDERDDRMLPAAVAPAGDGGFAFLSSSEGAPTRWDPCRPIHYVIHDSPGTPAGGDEAIFAAVAEASKASGIAFVYDGKTDEAANEDRLPFQLPRYGDRWAPVLIAWSDSTQLPALAGTVLGVSQPRPYRAAAGDDAVYVSGTIGLDTPDLTSLDPQGSRFTDQSVVEHELGHLLGLDHVQDPTQLMYPTSEGVLAYQAGDRRGLAALGAGSCHPEL